MNRAAVIVLSLALCCLRGFAQTKPPMKSLKDAENFVAKAELDDCQASVQQWKDWAAINVPRCEQWEAKAAALQDSSRENRIEMFLVFAAVGVGLFMAWGAVKAIRHWWPVSNQRRQLILLLAIAAWVTVAAVIAANDSRLTIHPVNLVLSVFVYSLPALAFGGIGVWWFGRTKPEVLW